MMGAIAIFDSAEAFWGWGFFLVSITILNHYGFWDSKVLLKVVFYLNATLIVFIISVLFRKEPLSHVLNLVVYAFFLCFCLIFINREELERLFREKQDIVELIQIMNHDKMVIEELRERLGDTLDVDNIESLMKSMEARKKMLARDERTIRCFLEALPIEKKLANSEIELLSIFLMHSGSLPNKELAFILNTSEDAIKNRFKMIFQKLRVSSRTELYSFLLKQ